MKILNVYGNEYPVESGDHYPEIEEAVIEWSATAFKTNESGDIILLDEDQEHVVDMVNDFYKWLQKRQNEKT